jgi:linearmycin/streptolysin S transport system permease protein
MARTALLIAAKDVRQRLRDRSALLVAIVVPLVLASIFGLIFHDVTSGRVAFAVAIVDQDRGDAARALQQRALQPLARQGLIKLRTESSVAAARDAADQGKVAAAIVVPAGFTAAVHGGRPLRVDVIGDVDSPIGTQVAESIVQSFAGRVQTARIARAAAGPQAPGPDRIGAGPIELADISTASQQLDVGTFYAAGMAVFFLFFTVQFGVSSIIDERRDGTLARMLVAPIRRGAVLAGKLLTSVVLGATSMVVLAVTTALLLDAHWGDPLGVALLIFAGVLAATAVMALVATLAKTPDQAQAWQSMVALVLGMLGGTFFPIAQAGGALAALSLLTPQAWFLRGIENLAGGEGPSAVAGPVLAMLAFAAVVGALAFARAGRLIAR